MGVMSDVHSLWEEWQMRVLVLSSLSIQFFLSFIPLLRRYAMPVWMRYYGWLVFLVSDALVIYALATLFDRHKADGSGRRGGSSTLEVVWAPILLAHLAGLHSATAWNIEDNERWIGSLLTAVHQVALAIYVFCKSWPGGDKKLKSAAILLFVYGGLKCFEKPWAVKRASFTSLVRSQAGDRRARQSEGQMVLAAYVEAARVFFEAQKARAPVEEVATDRRRPSSQVQDRDINEIQEPDLYGEAYTIIVDRSSPYDRRLQNLKYFLGLKEDRSYDCVRRGLTGAFLHFYTRFKLVMTTGIADLDKMQVNGMWDRLKRFKTMFLHQCTQLSGMLPWAAIGLFHQSHRKAYNDIDVKVTYALLCCTAVLEYSNSIGLSMSLTDEVSDHKNSKSRGLWTEVVKQYSLIEYFSRNKNYSKLMWIASKFGCRDMVDQHWCMEPCFSSSTIAELVLQYLKYGWDKKIQDVASYRSFNDNRGHLALEGNEHLSWSIKEPFDESVLLWHIATDFCFFSSQEFSEHRCRAVQCRQMSNYMVYLLFVNPEMLLPGSRRSLFTIAYDDLKDILGENKPNLFATAYKELKDILMDDRQEQDVYRRISTAIKELKDILTDNKRNPISRSQWNPELVKEEGIIERVISVILDKSLQASEDEGSKKGSVEESGLKDGNIEEPKKKGCKQNNFIIDAWALAQQLLALGDEKMWGVIQRVWLEMLCFSASRCRGYLHAKALGAGGEFLSYVWLLMFYMGMETFTERLERGREVVLPSHQESNSAAQASQASDDAHEGKMTTSSTSRIRNRGASSPSHVHTSASTSSSEIHIVVDKDS